jgi:hypothetical protein
LGDHTGRATGQCGPNGGNAVSAIPLELLARTVFELMRLPEFANSDFRDLTFRAHELLIECVRTIDHFEQGNCTYVQAIREITGWKRISAKELKLFEKFYKDTYLSFPSRVPRGSSLDLPIAMLTRQRQLREWKEDNSVPIKVCLEINRDFIKWNRKRQSEIHSAKGLKGVEAKKLKNHLRPRKTKPGTSQRQN